MYGKIVVGKVTAMYRCFGIGILLSVLWRNIDIGNEKISTDTADN